MRRVVSFILRCGAIISGILMVGGAALYFVMGSASAVETHSLAGLWSGLRSGNPLSVIELGIITLLLTPIASVLTIGLNLLRLRDWRTAGAALAILFILLVSYVLH
jgi:uncharacterized membrane protein